MNKNKQKIIDMMNSIKQLNPDFSDRKCWRVLLEESVKVFKETGCHQTLIEFFRYAIDSSDEVEDSDEWKKKMKEGLNSILRLVQIEDQLKTAGVPSDYFSKGYEQF
jgi:hypothetical protein